MADAATLARALGCSHATAERYAADFNDAMVQAGCTTVNRAAMWCAQIGHESLGLRYMEEIADGSNYEGRADLGNTVRGDGVRFKGRGPIQLTGRTNYTRFGGWAFDRGLVADARYFLTHPTEVATSTWGFLAAAWYWTVARPRLNAQADAGDIVAATRSINGGTNGLADRQERWDRCLQLGSALLPTHIAASEEDEMDPEDRRMLRELYMQLVQGDGQAAKPPTWGWPGWAGGTGEHLTVVDMLRRLNVEVRQLRNQINKN